MSGRPTRPRRRAGGAGRLARPSGCASAPIPVIPWARPASDVTAYGQGPARQERHSPAGGMDLGVQAHRQRAALAERRGQVPGLVRPPGTEAPAGRGATAGSLPSTGRTWREPTRASSAAFGVPWCPPSWRTRPTGRRRRPGSSATRWRCGSARRRSATSQTSAAWRTSACATIRSSVRLSSSQVGRRRNSPHDGGNRRLMVSPMRTGGVELLAGRQRGPGFGPVLAVGLGGIWVEVLARRRACACCRPTRTR